MNFLKSMALFCLVTHCFAQKTHAAFLLKHTHHTEFSLSRSQNSTRIWIPLPLDYATQVPLSINVVVLPQKLRALLQYTVDSVGNFGVWIELPPSSENTLGSIHSENLVFTLEVPNESERIGFYSAEGHAPDQLSSTEVVAAGYPPIQSLSRDIFRASRDVFQALQGVQSWVSSQVHYAFPGRLDSMTAFETRQSTCTGFANLSAALGRSMGVASQTIAGYVVGISQQTHSLVERYLATTQSWVRVEPQSPNFYPVPEDYFVSVRKNRSEDEGAPAMVSPLRAGMIPPGVPSFSMLEVKGETSRFSQLKSTYFPECHSCDNKAEKMRSLGGSYEQSKQLFLRARRLWQRDLTKYAAGTIRPEIESKRLNAFQVMDLKDLEEYLSSL